ncbi:MAG TPA: NADH-quinone oxidoreductase subunit K [Candidatus Omnitrophota bacterium]|nr:NADH-quinone oxidoreductase subunit K [Candidatus Omnitrophota bacterium]
MSGNEWSVFCLFGFFIVLVFVSGIYCILATRNIIRAIVGWELLVKAVTLLMTVVGYVTRQTALIQSFIITIVVIEVIVATVAGGIALRVFKYNDDLDLRKLTKLKG